LGEKVVDTSGSDWYSTAASITLSQSAAVCATETHIVRLVRQARVRPFPEPSTGYPSTLP
jgi:hypothetical protein